MKIATLIILSLIPRFVKAQELVKDTLFFSYDTQYIITHKEIPNHFYIKDGSGGNIGEFFFTRVQKIENYKTKKREIGLKKFIRSSKFFDENRRLN